MKSEEKATYRDKKETSECLELGSGMEMNCAQDVIGGMKCSNTDVWCWLHHSAKLLRITELYIRERCFLSIFKLKNMLGHLLFFN